MAIVTVLAIIAGGLGIGSTLVSFAAQKQFNENPDKKMSDLKLFKKKQKYIKLERRHDD